ncbi:alpha/beta fold hydrolase [Algibacillus agarilyticus]|uniref:alpha/beta fold hydrolase n=1 Tax=Algibacillus agarilyticus TaxID=2234133 RepID=UPI000DD023AA|nr:alpha/beta fold hydrolase [Algibacillus agarilyticus]
MNKQYFKAETPNALLILAHGAGAGSQHDFMQFMARNLSAQGISVLLFDFPYMQMMYETGKRRPPNKLDILIESYKAVLYEAVEETDVPVFIAGKSMGGRIASHLSLICADLIAGVIALGYPFHPPGKPEKTRLAHFNAITSPFLIIQGERDTFGNKSDVESYQLAQYLSTRIKWLPDGDHSFKPRKASGFSLDDNLSSAIHLIKAFVDAPV